MSENVFDLLIALEQRANDHRKPLPSMESHEAIWTGVSFRIASVLCVVSLNEISEVLRYPKLTEIPGAVDWLIGIINLRGEIIPVMDVPAFLGYGRIKDQKKARVMVVEHENGKSGMLINQIMGLYHFKENQKRPPMNELKPGFIPFTTGAFCTENSIWNLFSLKKITNNPKFFQVSA